jgi:hypothetical protein
MIGYVTISANDYLHALAMLTQFLHLGCARTFNEGGTDEGVAGKFACRRLCYGAYLREPVGNKLCAYFKGCDSKSARMLNTVFLELNSLP